MTRWFFAKVFAVFALVSGVMPASAEFETHVGGNKVLGNFVPSFYGGVVFETCAGVKWTIDGADFTWTAEKCNAGRTSAVATIAWANPFGGGGIGSPRPKPKTCGLCSKHPDLVDYLKPEPKWTPCALCTEAGLPDTIYRFELDTPRTFQLLQATNPSAIQTMTWWNRTLPALQYRPAPAYNDPNVQRIIRQQRQFQAPYMAPAWPGGGGWLPQ